MKLSTRTTTTTYEELFHRVADRDQEAFRTLFQLSYDPLCREAQRVIRCEARAQEIVCDVFTSLWQRERRLDAQTNVRGYLRRAVRNRAIDYLRRQMREGRVVSLEDYDASANYDSPQDKLEEAEMSARIQRAITSLPPRGKQIFLMSRSHGLTYRDIAQRLGLSIKTVETHMRRSLIHLRAAFPEVA